MSQHARRVVVLCAVALVASVSSAALALGASVKVGPVKGARYTGVVRGVAVTLKVAKDGKSATASLANAPFYCSGGGGPEPHRAKAGAISKGKLTTTVAFSTTGSSSKPLATVTVKGVFVTFSGAKPVFQGTAATTYAIAGASSCNGHSSFQAKLAK